MERRTYDAWLCRALCLCAALMLTVILALLILGQGAYGSAYSGAKSLIGNAPLWAGALCVIALLFWLRSREEGEKKQRLWLLRGLFLGVLAVQFLVARCCWTHLGWDPGEVHRAAEEIARGLPISNGDYFRLCPNNAPLTLLLVPPLWVAVKLGLGVPYMVLPYVDAVILNLTAYLTTRCVYRLTQSRTARWFAAALSIGWIALSPYILYPYTDVYVVLFPLLALWVWLFDEKPLRRWALISLFSFIGYAIKPTALIVFIALMLLEGLRFLAAKPRKARLRRAAAVLCLIVVCAVPGVVYQRLSITALAGSARPEEQLSLTHYLMLGMNGDTYGGHSDGDVDFSKSYPTLSERQTANLQKARERLCSRSLTENLHFFAVKAYKAYADGSFAAHPSFIHLEIPERTDKLSTFLRSLYMKKSTYGAHCVTIAQFAWLGVLTLCAYAVVVQRRRPVVTLISLTLMGLTLYLLLFEVWPRYLFLYAPFFVILSALAFDRPFGKAYEP